ncbi:MAG: DUF4920 domain-containing protein [Chitinophagaceae bacterium]
MKRSFVFMLLFAVYSTSAQEASEIIPAAKGVVYGIAPAEKGEIVNLTILSSKLAAGAFEGKVTGTVKEVCKAMGCWIKLQKEDGTTLMVKAKDHSFFMPENLTGKTVVIEGTASVQTVSEEKRKHFAEDGGGTKEEIKKIKGSGKEIQFVASGVKVID